MQDIKPTNFQRSFEYDGAKRKERKEERKRREERRGKRNTWQEKE